MTLIIIEHNGSQIYFNDWTNLKNPEQFSSKVEESNDNTRELITQGKKDILTLTDVTGSFIFGDSVRIIKEASLLANGITKKSATIGLSSAKKLLLNSLNIFAKSNVKAFNTIEEAKDWLIE